MTSSIIEFHFRTDTYRECRGSSKKCGRRISPASVQGDPDAHSKNESVQCRGPLRPRPHFCFLEGKSMLVALQSTTFACNNHVLLSKKHAFVHYKTEVWLRPNFSEVGLAFSIPNHERKICSGHTVGKSIKITFLCAFWSNDRRKCVGLWQAQLGHPHTQARLPGFRIRLV